MIKCVVYLKNIKAEYLFELLFQVWKIKLCQRRTEWDKSMELKIEKLTIKLKILYLWGFWIKDEELTITLIKTCI